MNFLNIVSIRTFYFVWSSSFEFDSTGFTFMSFQVKASAQLIKALASWRAMWSHRGLLELYLYNLEEADDLLHASKHILGAGFPIPWKLREAMTVSGFKFEFFAVIINIRI